MLTLTNLYGRALHLNGTVAQVVLRGERIRGAKRYTAFTLQETSAFLRDFRSLSESGVFHERQLSAMLGNTCLETSSFLFAAGAPSDVWRAWCSLAGFLVYLQQDLGYAMQLLTISRTVMPDEVVATLSHAELKPYRQQAIQCILFRDRRRTPPVLAPADSLDDAYQTILHALEVDDMHQLQNAVDRIVDFWLHETSYGRFEPGAFPVFESEINAVVAALVMQDVAVQPEHKRVSNFLRAALE